MTAGYTKIDKEATVVLNVVLQKFQQLEYNELIDEEMKKMED